MHVPVVAMVADVLARESPRLGARRERQSASECSRAVKLRVFLVPWGGRGRCSVVVRTVLTKVLPWIRMLDAEHITYNVQHRKMQSLTYCMGTVSRRKTRELRRY